MEKLIDKFLPADYHDTFVIKASKPAEQIVPKELIEKIFNHSPAWLSFLYKVRNILVKPFGIEGGDILTSEDYRRYRERSHHEEGRQASVVLCFHCQDRQ